MAFGAGMLSFLSPCVLPLVPAYLSMVSGLSAAELSALRTGARPCRRRRRAGGRRWPAPAARPSRRTGDRRSSRPTGTGGRAGPARRSCAGERSRLLRGILAFIAGFTVVFTILGASASAVGRLFLTHQRRWRRCRASLIVVFGAMLVAMAAGVGLPMALSGERRFTVRPSVLGAWAPPVMGMAFAFAWTPCIGPVLGSVLALAAGTGGSATGGIALLLAYSLGLGVPVPAQRAGLRPDDRPRWPGCGAGSGESTWSAGSILIVFGLLLLTGNVDVISAHISELAP